MDDNAAGFDALDRELRHLAHGALAEAEWGVDTAAGLAEVHRRAADVQHDPRGADRSPWLLLGAAAAVIGLVVGGIVLSRDGTDDTIRTATSDQPVESASGSTTPPVPSSASQSTLSPSSTDVPPSTAVPGSPPPTIVAVDAANPPPLIEPVAFASLPLENNPNGNSIEVAIVSDGVIVQQPDTSYVSIIGPSDDQVVRLEVEEQLSSIVGGPGAVYYGLGPVVLDEGAAVPSGSRFQAIAFAGERAGQVVAETIVGLNEYLELPPGAFGHGPDGIIDRGRNPNATVIGYVDENGDPTDWYAANAADPEPILIEREYASPGGDPLISVVGSDLAWQLDITYAPDNGGDYLGPSAPAPTTGGRIVYSERIGSDQTPGQDFGPNAMPVVAILEPSGGGYWVRLPDDWSVAASDVWGTILMRTSNGVLELARLDDALATLAPPAAPSAPPSGETLAVDVGCVGDGYNCTQLASTEDGRIVSYDPVAETIEVFDAAGQNVEGRVELAAGLADRAPWFITVGPDDVAYFTATPAGAGDPIRDLLAIPISGPSAGVAVVVADGLDGSGDSDLVPTANGLAVVGCCGFDPLRPRADATVYPWLDSSGRPTTSPAPAFRWELSEPRDLLVRVDGSGSTEFDVPLVATSPRGMPWIVPTDDGGALMSIYSQLTSGSYLIRFVPGAPASVYGIPTDASLALLESTGNVVVRDGDRFVRRSPAEFGVALSEVGPEFRTEDGQAIASCRNPGVLAVDGTTAVNSPWSVRGGRAGDNGLYIAVDDIFGRRVMTGCGELAGARQPLAGEGVLVWPIDDGAGVLLAVPAARQTVGAPSWLDVPVAQLIVDSVGSIVELYVVADDVELPTTGSDVRDRLLVELIRQTRADGTSSATFGPVPS